MKSVKKAFVILTFIGVITLVFGGILLASTYPYGESADVIFAPSAIEKTSYDEKINTADVQEINITTSYSVSIKTSEDQSDENVAVGGTVTTYGISFWHTRDSFSKAGGKIEIVVKTNCFGIILFRDGVLTVTIPQSFSGKLKINSTSGTTKIDATNNFEDIIVNQTSGKLNIANIKTKKISSKCTSGRIDISNVTADEFVTSSTSGGISLSNINTPKIVATLTSGSLNINQSKAVSLDVKITSGSATINMPKLDTNKFYAKYSITSGSLRGNYLGSSGSNGAIGNPDAQIKFDFKMTSGTITFNKSN